MLMAHKLNPLKRVYKRVVSLLLEGVICTIYPAEQNIKFYFGKYLCISKLTSSKSTFYSL